MKRVHPAHRPDPPRVGEAPRILAYLTALLLLVLSCASYERVAPDEIGKGDYVHLSTWGGGTKRFEVRDVRDGLVVGKNTQVAVMEIKGARRMVPLVDDAEHASWLTVPAGFLYYLFSLNWLP